MSQLRADEVALKPAGASKWPRARRRWLAPFAPLTQTLRGYQRADLPKDVLAGLTVAVVDLPQSMAFALVAGVAPIYGLYTSIVLGMLGALFTSSRFLSVGPTNTQSLLVAAIVSRLTSDPRLYLQMAFGLTLLKGVIQLAFAAARMGRLVRYVSRSVMIGFTAGAGMLIIVGQVPIFLGLPPSNPIRHHALPGLLGAVQLIATQLPAINPRAVALGLVGFALMVGSKRFSRGVPGSLLAVVVSAFVVWIAGFGEGDVPLVGGLPRGLPAFALPRLDVAQLESLLPGALALALLGMLESVMIAKTVGPRALQPIDADQELFGQGFANFVGGWFQCLPGSGSFSRTALQHSAGAQTRLANVFCASFNALAFLTLAPAARYIPSAALAAILLVIGASLIDLPAITRIVRASRADAVVCGVTFLAALVLPLSYAIYFGIFLSIALYLRHASRLHLIELVPTEGGSFEERPLHAARTEIVFVQLEGDLFFALADDLAEQLGRLHQGSTRVAILRLKRTRWIDASVLFVLENFVNAMRARGGYVLLCGVRPELRQRLGNFGLLSVIGEANVFATEASVFASAKQAFRRANELVDAAKTSA